ncbi:MAG: hypothetical protein GY786_13900 [Proteobacteria bacterium]|nr:hypothetical protein [Pseudomonadota bacterium]
MILKTLKRLTFALTISILSFSAHAADGEFGIFVNYGQMDSEATSGSTVTKYETSNPTGFSLIYGAENLMFSLYRNTSEAKEDTVDGVKKPNPTTYEFETTGLGFDYNFNGGFSEDYSFYIGLGKGASKVKTTTSPEFYFYDLFYYRLGGTYALGTVILKAEYLVEDLTANRHQEIAATTILLSAGVAF